MLDHDLKEGFQLISICVQLIFLFNLDLRMIRDFDRYLSIYFQLMFLVKLQDINCKERISIDFNGLSMDFSLDLKSKDE